MAKWLYGYDGFITAVQNIIGFLKKRVEGLSWKDLDVLNFDSLNISLE